MAHEPNESSWNNVFSLETFKTDFLFWIKSENVQRTEKSMK